MQIAIVGGGPGGLYASILLKKAHPNWEVTVYERNPPDLTYGWGIVFPHRTLSNLEEADEPSHDDISETTTRWEPFDIYYKGERYRSRGHTFASMLRTDLLTVLQDRCAALDVNLVFEEPIENPQTLADEGDLLIGADGIYSHTREVYSAEMGTETIEGSSRFAWFGTEADFDALSHVFVQNEDGIWCAHTYPGSVSTFIVDCDPETWTNARLDERSEAAYIGYLEDVFADYLDGHALLSQQDRWRTFTTVRNDTWYYDNVVLLGDAAHTAHYSIGSGTTIAMEDAIGLARAFDDYDEVETALSTYESQRRPSSQSLQRTAERSRLHFERVRRFFDFEGIQFTLHHLTRSGRLSYSSLSRRDAELVGEFDRWFAATTLGGVANPEAVDEPLAPAAQPFELRGVTVPNRAVSVGEPTASAVEGQPTDAQLVTFQERAACDPGLTLTEPLAVAQDGRITPGSPGIYEEAHEAAWADMLTSVEGPTGAHLVHAGQRGAVQPRAFALDRPIQRNEAWAPRLSEQYPTRPASYAPVTMDKDDLDRVRESFVTAAKRADTAGFEYIQLHLGNGYLLGSFLSPVTNDRTDEFGGDLDGRMRFPLTVVDAVRAVWSDEKPLGVTMQAVDWTTGGLTDDAFIVGEKLADRGVDLFAPVAGGITERDSPDEIHGLANYSDELRNELDVATMATVQATTVDEVNTLVATGRADLCTFYGSYEDVQ